MSIPVLWHSNAPWANSGYGSQTRLFAPRVRDLGFDVAISAFYGVAGAVLGWQGMKVYPGTGNAYGNDILTPHALHHFKHPTPGVERKPVENLRDGLIVTLMDVWVLKPELFDRAHGAAWVPVDHDPVPPKVAAYFATQPNVLPIAMSRFGQRALQAALGPAREVAYVPHGVETDVYVPFDDEARAEARKSFGVDDEGRFIVGVVAANQGNPSRKCFPEMLQAFAAFLRTEEGRDALLYLHTDRIGRNSGVDLELLIPACGIPPENVRFVAQYEYLTGQLDDEYMVKAYNAMDVLLNPSMGEGFGIPIIEAQACGTPVIVTENTAMTEVGAVGWHVPGQEFWTAQNSWMTIPSVEGIVESLQMAASGMAHRKRGAARQHALQYDADRVTETYWRPVLEQLAAKVAESRKIGSGFLLPEPVASA
jgi:glycosyltransferase involved in cell wall biosynthesis